MRCCSYLGASQQKGAKRARSSTDPQQPRRPTHIFFCLNTRRARCFAASCDPGRERQHTSQDSPPTCLGRARPSAANCRLVHHQLVVQLLYLLVQRAASLLQLRTDASPHTLPTPACPGLLVASSACCHRGAGRARCQPRRQAWAEGQPPSPCQTSGALRPCGSALKQRGNYVTRTGDCVTGSRRKANGERAARVTTHFLRLSERV